jgi:hypothetical protein
MKMGRRRRCSSVTYQSRYAPSSRPAAAGPEAHFDRNESHVIYGTGHLLVLSNFPIELPYSLRNRRPREIRRHIAATIFG